MIPFLKPHLLCHQKHHRCTFSHLLCLQSHFRYASQHEFSTEIRVEVGNQRGVLAEVASTISDTDSNIEHVHTEERDGVTTALTFVITTHDRQHLAKIMKRLKALPPVIRITRQMA